MQNNKKIFTKVEIPDDLEYFAENSQTIWKYLRKYHNVLLLYGAIVKSDPVFLKSKKTGNSFAKFTIELESPVPWIQKKELPLEQRGDVYVDCFAFENKKDSPGEFILNNIKKGCIISGIAILKSGKKPVKEKGDEYRSNWVYGDYVYMGIQSVKVDREATYVRKESPYKGRGPIYPYYDSFADYKSISEDDIKFNL